LETGRQNAALVGIGSTRRILLSDALLADYRDDEIEVVLAHELAHHVNYDIWKTMVYETVVVVAAAGVGHLVMVRFGVAFEMAGPHDVGGLPLLVLIGGAVVMVLAPVRNVMSRQYERRADQYALKLTKNPAALVSSLRRFEEQTLAEERPSRVVEWLFYTHPPMADRLSSSARAATEDTRL
jgi:STE24 endopeptidase